jgi:acyl phosphate:glycerol-3-phosphate acyltransferase
MAITIAILSYLLGSIPTGYLLGLYAGVDVRKTGSGNIGATNVARALGKMRGVLTLLADAAKGAVPVYIATQLDLGEMSAAIVGAAAFLGHLFPVYLKFKGGKGVATAVGVLFALAPMAALVLLAVFAAALLICRMVSLSSIAAALAAPIAVWLFHYPLLYTVLAAFLSIMVIVRHRSNIQRLLAGTEPRWSPR